MPQSWEFAGVEDSGLVETEGRIEYVQHTVGLVAAN
jgi:hypothetical protein